MLRITESESSTAALHYFGQCLSRGDYYLDGQEIAGQWGGKGAVALGLKGAVEKELFECLLENRRPDRTPLTARTVANRRPGYDFTFDVPKSVSLLHLLSGDERIVEAMRRAIRKTMDEMEEEMHARVRKGGAFFERRTGNAIFADFVHLTSRPTVLPADVERAFLKANPWLESYRGEDGRLALPDPHLHAHVFVMNATFDREEGIWKAGDFMRLKRDATYYQAAYHTRLAEELQLLGYPIEPTANAFEIAGVARSIIEVFSRRTREVEEAAKRLGILDNDTKATLAALTRRTKVPELGLKHLTQIWRGLLPAQILARLDGIKTAAKAVGVGRVIDDRTVADAGVRYALGHELERVSQLSEKRLLGRALTRTVGHASVDTVRRVMRGNPQILFAEVGGERLLTTPEVLGEESSLLDLVRAGRGQCLPLILGKYVFKHPAFKTPDGKTREQQLAIDGLLRSTDWITGLLGRAGTGKTTVLQEMDLAVREAGKKLMLCAPTAEASRGVLRGEGFATADTVKQFITNPVIHAQMRGAVLWVDEAGMIGNRDLLALLRIAKREQAARVILAGDTRQIRSVPRGDAFDFMINKGGLRVVRLNTIRRQRTEHLRRAVEAVSQGDIREAFELLDRTGCVIEADAKASREALAKAYADKLAQRDAKGRHKTALVISPTHMEGEQITSAIRSEMKGRGLLNAADRKIPRTVPLSWTAKQRETAASYEPGLLVQFQRATGGYARGERVRVVDVNARQDQVMVRSNLGLVQPLPLKAAEKFQVYAVRELPVAAGDRLKITENGTDSTGKHRLSNGDLVNVAGFTDEGGVKLSNGWELPRDFGNLTHGYVITADASQAKTVDAVYLAIGRESLGATDMRRFYVMLSRAREEARIFTHDKEELQRAAGRVSERRSALDLVGEDRAADVLRRQQIGRARAVEDMQRARIEQQLRQQVPARTVPAKTAPERRRSGIDFHP